MGKKGVFGSSNFSKGGGYGCGERTGMGSKAMANTRGESSSRSPTNQSGAKGKGMNHSNDVKTTPGGYKGGK